MKASFTILLIFFAGVAFGNEFKSGDVHLVENVPVYLFSSPVESYTETGSINTSFTGALILSDEWEELAVDEKVNLIVRRAKRRLRRGTVADFDAIMINRDGWVGTMIKFDEEKSTRSRVEMVDNVPIYVFNTPNRSYKEVGMLNNVFETTFSSRSVNSFVRRAKRKLRKGKIEEFDAIVISNDGVRAFPIKFDN